MLPMDFLHLLLLLPVTQFIDISNHVVFLLCGIFGLAAMEGEDDLIHVPLVV